MQFSSSVQLLLACLLAVPGLCQVPQRWGMVLFNSMDALDVVGPFSPLYILSFSKTLNLSLIAETLDPVYARPLTPAINVMNSSFTLSINPTHTFDNAPEDIEVLLVPGGAAARAGGNLTTTVDYVRKTYPKVKYFLSICTGAGIAAKAGVLDGKRATTNKAAWKLITAMGPNVQWTSPARWVVDGNVWTSSGVTSGLDMIFEFIEEVYGEEFAYNIQGPLEYKRTTDPCDDPFAARYKVPDSGHCGQ